MSDQDTTNTTGPKPWQFQPGNNANPRGRPKGARNRLGETFVLALEADFKVHGVSVIKAVRIDRPHEYLKVVASLLPKVVEIKDDAFDGIESEQLAALIVAAREALGFADGSGARSADESGAEPPDGVSAVH
jgi:hypothetical protein